MVFGESENNERTTCGGVVNKLRMWNTTVADNNLPALSLYIHSSRSELISTSMTTSNWTTMRADHWCCRLTEIGKKERDF